MRPTLPQTYYFSQKKVALFLLLALLLAAGSGVAALDSNTDERWLWWAGTGLFGWASVVFIRQMFDRSPRLIITSTGITDHTLPVGEIRWADISDSTLTTDEGNAYINLYLLNREKYLTHLSPLQQRLLGRRGAVLVLNLTNLNADAVEVLATVQAWQRGLC